METRLLLALYKLGGIRLVRSSISDAILGLSIKHGGPYVTERKKHALKSGRLFCKAFLSATNRDKIGIDADPDFIHMYTTILRAFREDDFKKYKGTVEEIYKILIDVEKGEPISEDERRETIEKLNELYNVFQERASSEEEELLMVKI